MKLFGIKAWANVMVLIRSYASEQHHTFDDIESYNTYHRLRLDFYMPSDSNVVLIDNFLEDVIKNIKEKNAEEFIKSNDVNYQHIRNWAKNNVVIIDNESLYLKKYN